MHVQPPAPCLALCILSFFVSTRVRVCTCLLLRARLKSAGVSVRG